MHFVTVTNDIFKVERKHYVTIYVRSDWKAGIPKVLEPDKMIKWKWFSLRELPEPLFLPMTHLDLVAVASLL